MKYGYTFVNRLRMSVLSEKAKDTACIFICYDVFKALSLVPLLEQSSESVFIKGIAIFKIMM